MPSFRHREEDSSVAPVLTGAVIGALAGFAVGMFAAQKLGGFAGIGARMRSRMGDLRRDMSEDGVTGEGAYDAYGVGDEDDLAQEAIEERVLEAFQRDAVLKRRAVDIGAVGAGTIELTGWVNSVDESERAAEVARNALGVETVVNRLEIGERERTRRTAAERLDRGDDALTEARWEGQRIGTGRRRQGTSAESDRHADPKNSLEERWLDKEHAKLEAADDPEGIVEGVTEPLQGRSGGAREEAGGRSRASGGRTAPGGVPKADNVANPPRSHEDEG
ncbi:MAG TPA: BON domain-containing protein [Gemmatimonadaceae bacterium]|nr:BON domain-containing protein [Gemmatimonadaceae bacterium]